MNGMEPVSSPVLLLCLQQSFTLVLNNIQTFGPLVPHFTGASDCYSADHMYEVCNLGSLPFLCYFCPFSRPSKSVVHC